MSRVGKVRLFFRKGKVREMKAKFKVGDGVKVKAGIMDPDIKNSCIGGWQGRIVGITTESTGDVMVDIKWDSITLKNIPEKAIKKSEQEGFDWTMMTLSADEVESAQKRDTESDVEKAAAMIAKDHAWDCLNDEGDRIKKVLAGVDEDNEIEALQAWEDFLFEKLEFPFDAKVAEYQERGRLKVNDKVKVVEIVDTDDLYGIIVNLRHKARKKSYDFPLCDLEVTDKKSANYLPVKDYCVWFANR